MIETLNMPKLRPAVAIDFDGTYTLNPKMWAKIVRVLSEHGFDPWIVTMRTGGGTDEQEVRDTCKGAPFVGFIFTDCKAKKAYCQEHYPSIWFSFWCDDNPHWILQDANFG